jgi:probable phosphoglycerate mutase
MTPHSDQPWPSALWLVRHGQSAGNVARAAADERGAARIDLTMRDVDVELSDLGRRQAHALARWLEALPEAERPSAVISSPYVRAIQTAELILPRLEHRLDERLREKEMGMFDMLTRTGITASHPGEAERYDRLGKFYYRPPGGESWCDVIARLRSFVDELRLQYCGERVLVVAHQVTVMCFRYLLERLTEAQLLAIDREAVLANCSVTEYRLARDAQGRATLALERYNFCAPIADSGEPITQAPDARRIR